ncbi:MAG: oligosaccharide flippase family protein [Patescibacteria group bacterium]|nr:oligosaccharide flippase family protein [Patescibacteria group bacterium]MDD4611072.1 oligosaccharide flippase family protein [Patescibacteria group bacterium]
MINKIKNKTYNLLRWSEKWMQTDMIYIAKGGFWLTLGQIISSASSFLLAIAFANLLPKETYGIYKYILSVAGILSIPTLSGINTAIIQAVARGYEGTFNRALKTKILWGILGGIASLFLAGYYYYLGNSVLTISFLIAAIFTPFMDSLTLYSAFLNGKKEFKLSTRYNIIIQTVSTLTIIAVLFLTKNIFLLILFYFISYTSSRFISHLLVKKKFVFNDKEDPHTISYGKHLSLVYILGAISLNIDKILVFHYLGAAELAIYTIAVAPPEQIKSLIKTLIVSLTLPKFSEKSTEEIKKTIYNKIVKVIIGVLSVTLFYLAAAPFIYKIFFHEYPESVLYSQFYAISLLAVMFYIPLTILQSQKKTKELYQFNVSTSLIQIALVAIFVIPFGLKGAIVANVLSKFASLAISFILLKRI